MDRSKRTVLPDLRQLHNCFRRFRILDSLEWWDQVLRFCENTKCLGVSRVFSRWVDIWYPEHGLVAIFKLRNAKKGFVA